MEKYGKTERIKNDTKVWDAVTRNAFVLFIVSMYNKPSSIWHNVFCGVEEILYSMLLLHSITIEYWMPFFKIMAKVLLIFFILLLLFLCLSLHSDFVHLLFSNTITISFIHVFRSCSFQYLIFDIILFCCLNGWRCVVHSLCSWLLTYFLIDKNIYFMSRFQSQSLFNRCCYSCCLVWMVCFHIQFISDVRVCAPQNLKHTLRTILSKTIYSTKILWSEVFVFVVVIVFVFRLFWILFWVALYLWLFKQFSLYSMCDLLHQNWFKVSIECIKITKIHIMRYCQIKLKSCVVLVLFPLSLSLSPLYFILVLSICFFFFFFFRTNGVECAFQ